ncbi:zf-HC2 domain-containing protein, partial [Singulisphaera rosea]
MDVPNSSHPSDRILNDYGLGKLDDRSEVAVHEHLESCQRCRQRVAGITSDTFLGRFRDVREASPRSIPHGSPD